MPAATDQLDVLAVARSYVAGGRSVIPVKLDGSKAPASDMLPRIPDPDRPDRFIHSWRPFQDRKPTDEELLCWYGGDKPFAIAVACGRSSGGAECIDYDDKETAREFLDVVRADRPGLYKLLSLEVTPNGLHIWYLADALEGNRALAGRPDGFDSNGREKFKKIIETRGQGGYAIVAGSPVEAHVTKRPYEHLSGPTLGVLERISNEDRDYLFQLAALFDQQKKPSASTKHQRHDAEELSPGDDFDLRGEFFSMLLPDAKFSRENEDRGTVTRPGKERGISGTVGHCRGSRGEPLLKVFTSNWYPFELNKTYGRFQVLRLTQFNGDGMAATKALAARGFGSHQTQGAARNPSANGKHTSNRDSDNSDTEPPASRYQFIDSAEFRKRDYRVRWFVDYYLARDYQAVVAGPSKSLKTSLLVDLAISLATATPHLGKWNVGQRVKVAIVSGESGGYALQETFFRALRARGLPDDACDGWLKWEFTLPTFADLIDVGQFAAQLAKLGCELVIIDPFYLCLGDIDAKSLFEMGRALRAVGEILMVKHGITPVIAHHANRQLAIGEPMDFQHLAYSGLEQWLGQYVLLNRREKYENDGRHELWLTYGGRPGHSGKWVLEVEEGLLGEDQPPRKWDVNVSSASDARDAETAEEKRANQQREFAQNQADEQVVMDVIDAEADRGFPGASVSWIADHGIRSDGKKLGDRRARSAVSRLVERNVIRRSEAFEVPSGNSAKRRVTNGYGRVPDD